jgi:hypothetical protein
MTPRIMTWGQYGEAALHYVQQVGLKCGRDVTAASIGWLPMAKGTTGAWRCSTLTTAPAVTACPVHARRGWQQSQGPTGRRPTSQTTRAAPTTSCCTRAATPSCAASRRASGVLACGRLRLQCSDTLQHGARHQRTQSRALLQAYSVGCKQSLPPVLRAPGVLTRMCVYAGCLLRR